MTKHLILLSFDAMGSEDFIKAREYPNFKRLIEKSSYSNDVSSVSPSLTYPAHTSIITSTLPENHGIITNTLFQPNRHSPDWYWHRKWIKAETLYDKAIDHGMKVASILWPVTARSRIQLNFPEIFANRKWQNQIMVSCFNGSPIYQYKLNKKHGHLRNGIEEPELDNFVLEALIDTLRDHRPDLTLCHFIDLDSMRHHYGYYSSQAEEALLRLDEKLGRILDFLDKEGMAKDTVLVVLGDHDQKPTHSVISLRRLFADKGLIQYEKGKISNYDVMTKTCDGSSYIYVNNRAKLSEVRTVLEEFKTSQNAVKAILDKEEINKIKADSRADFMVDAMDGYYFNDYLEDHVISPVEVCNGKARDGYLLSSHGYICSDRNYKTVFMIKGKGIKENYDIGSMNLIDEGMTFAKILGLSLDKGQGRILEDIFE